MPDPVNNEASEEMESLQAEIADLRTSLAQAQEALRDCKQWLEFRLSSPAFVPEIHDWIKRIDQALSPQEPSA